MVLDIPVVAVDPDLPLPSYARAGDAGADLVIVNLPHHPKPESLKPLGEALGSLA